MSRTIDDIIAMTNHATGIDYFFSNDIVELTSFDDDEIMREYDHAHFETMTRAIACVISSPNDTFNFVSYGDECFVLIYDNARVIACAYLSNRGRMYQCGLYDGHVSYFRSNVEHFNALNWTCNCDAICATIARDMYARAMRIQKRLGVENAS